MISVVATDFMGSTSEPAIIRVLKKSTASPQFVFSPPLHEIFRNQAVLITGDAEFSDCPIPKVPMDYTWRQASGPALPSKVEDTIISATGPQLYLKANSLDAGETYTFALTLSMGEDSPISSESMVTVSVAFQPIVAKISGGSSFLFSTFSEWKLDARKSRDPDNQQGSLSFLWRCSFLDGSTLSPCTDVEGSLLILKSEALLRIDSNRLAATQDVPYIFSVSVRDSAMRKMRDTAAVAVSIISSPTVSVDLEMLSASGLRGSDVVVNSDENTVFYADCGFHSENFQSISWDIKPSSDKLQGMLAEWVDNPYLILKGGSDVLQAGQQYSIEASCSETGAYGKGSVSINTNEPPSGGTCLVCLLGSEECITSGSPIVDTFRISCMNWADQDSPLQYHFGFRTGNEDTLWTAYRSSSFVDFVFPSGNIEIFAQVQDSLGESTKIIDITQGSGLQISTQYSRRLLLSGIDWTAALNQVNELAAKQSSKDMNSLIASMTLQNNFESVEKILDLESSKGYTFMLLGLAAQALSYSVKTADSVCESFTVNQKLTASPKLLGLESAINASSLVKYGLEDQSIIPYLDENCSSSALDTFNNIRVALSNMSSERGLIQEEKSFLETERIAIASVVHLYSLRLTTADEPFVRLYSSTFQRIALIDTAKLGEDIRFSVNGLVPGVNGSAVSFSLPAQQLLSSLNITTDLLTVHATASSYAPASSGLLIRSPVVGLTLSRLNGEACIVQGLSETINISIPFQKMPEAEWAIFRQQVECMYWDSGMKAYSTNGVKVLNVTKSNVICQSSHLTDFVLNQNLSIKLASPTFASPTFASTTKSSITTSFEDMLKVVGNRSAAMAMAKMPWQPTNISLSQSRQALELALKFAGGFGVPCTASVPFLVLPGLVLSTVKGTIYPKDYALEVETSRPAVQEQALVSAVTKFAVVQGQNTEPVQIEVAGFPLSQNRRSTDCAAATEWRYKWLGMPDYAVCSCAANLACKDETACVGTPSSGDRWAVAAVSTNLCTVSIPKGTQSADQSLALGLGLGLGLGLPLTAGSAVALFFLSKNVKGTRVEIRNNVQPSAGEISAGEFVFAADQGSLNPGQPAANPELVEPRSSTRGSSEAC